MKIYRNQVQAAKEYTDFKDDVLAHSISQLTVLQAQVVNRKGLEDSMVSAAKSKAGYDDTASTIFTETFANLTNWVTPVTPGVQVSSNKLYSTGSGGVASGANKSLALGATECLRAVFKVNFPSGGTSGALAIGISGAAAGAAPADAYADAYAIILPVSGTVQRVNKDTPVNTVEAAAMVYGDWKVTVIIDATYISLSAVSGTTEACTRLLRSTFGNINNLYIFNSDSRALTGASITLCSYRRGLQTVYPRTNGEAAGKSIQWTGSGTSNWRIYLPSTYDSRIPCNVVICFHGAGTDEKDWSVVGNMKEMQQALVNAGYIVLTACVTSQKNTWGNSMGTGVYNTAYQYLKNNYAISYVAFYAVSMGGIESFNLLAENTVPCIAWVGTSSTGSLLDIYTGSYNSHYFTDLIKEAYGIASDGSDYATKTSGRDPALLSPYKLRCLPMLSIAATDDTFVRKTSNIDVILANVANTALEVTNISTTGNHSFSITPYVAQMLAFFAKYFA